MELGGSGDINAWPYLPMCLCQAAPPDQPFQTTAYAHARYSRPTPDAAKTRLRHAPFPQFPRLGRRVSTHQLALWSEMA